MSTLPRMNCEFTPHITTMEPAVDNSCDRRPSDPKHFHYGEPQSAVSSRSGYGNVSGVGDHAGTRKPSDVSSDSNNNSLFKKYTHVSISPDDAQPAAITQPDEERHVATILGGLKEDLRNHLSTSLSVGPASHRTLPLPVGRPGATYGPINNGGYSGNGQASYMVDPTRPRCAQPILRPQDNISGCHLESSAVAHRQQYSDRQQYYGSNMSFAQIEPYNAPYESRHVSNRATSTSSHVQRHRRSVREPYHPYSREGRYAIPTRRTHETLPPLAIPAREIVPVRDPTEGRSQLNASPASEEGTEDSYPRLQNVQSGKQVCHIRGPGCDGQNFRKSISHFFGRNKSETKKIPDGLWLWHCRKDYQQQRYNMKKENKYWIVQLDLLREQLHRFEDNLTGLSWRIQWQSGLDRLVSLANQKDPANRRAQEDALAVREVQGALQINHLIGDNKTNADIHHFINEMERVLDAGPIDKDTNVFRVEFLLSRFTVKK